MAGIRRRDVLAGTALVLASEPAARAGLIAGHLPWEPSSSAYPDPVTAGGWKYFSAEEAAAVEVLADRIIPPDAQTPGGKDAGCAVFIDRQLAGPYGRLAGLYEQPPFLKGTKQQGPQSSQTPAELYRAGLAALNRQSRTLPGEKRWVELAAEQQNDILHRLESSTLELKGVDGKLFFEQVLKDVQQGFFADPIHGGNRDMCAWKMIGFPGARYDYREWVSRHNERYPYPPVSIEGRPEWTPK
ncbi:MAG TPA: gluconate 2-dehydrogenase subunit 3 family protein [Steroidobacteraceae bacterium]|jgi:gluconate 2-dehydrogenase gamma chain|nr:gluconate 2-dehydrogenase subunit 3 family protein [Steroidobacteraceae bacterium]